MSKKQNYHIEQIIGKINYTKVAMGMAKIWLYPYMKTINKIGLHDDLIQEIYLMCLEGKAKDMDLDEFKKLVNKRLYRFKTRQLGLYYSYKGKKDGKEIRKWEYREVSLEDKDIDGDIEDVE